MANDPLNPPKNAVQRLMGRRYESFWLRLPGGAIDGVEEPVSLKFRYPRSAGGRKPLSVKMAEALMEQVARGEPGTIADLDYIYERGREELHSLHTRGHGIPVSEHAQNYAQQLNQRHPGLWDVRVRSANSRVFIAPGVPFGDIMHAPPANPAMAANPVFRFGQPDPNHPVGMMRSLDTDLVEWDGRKQVVSRGAVAWNNPYTGQRQYFLNPVEAAQRAADADGDLMQIMEVKARNLRDGSTRSWLHVVEHPLTSQPAVYDLHDVRGVGGVARLLGVDDFRKVLGQRMAGGPGNYSIQQMAENSAARLTDPGAGLADVALKRAALTRAVDDLVGRGYDHSEAARIIAREMIPLESFAVKEMQGLKQLKGLSDSGPGALDGQTGFKFAPAMKSLIGRKGQGLDENDLWDIVGNARNSREIQERWASIGLFDHLTQDMGFETFQTFKDSGKRLRTKLLPDISPKGAPSDHGPRGMRLVARSSKDRGAMFSLDTIQGVDSIPGYLDEDAVPAGALLRHDTGSGWRYGISGAEDEMGRAIGLYVPPVLEVDPEARSVRWMRPDQHIDDFISRLSADPSMQMWGMGREGQRRWGSLGGGWTVNDLFEVRDGRMAARGGKGVAKSLQKLAGASGMTVGEMVDSIQTAGLRAGTSMEAGEQRSKALLDFVRRHDRHDVRGARIEDRMRKAVVGYADSFSHEVAYRDLGRGNIKVSDNVLRYGGRAAAVRVKGFDKITPAQAIAAEEIVRESGIGLEAAHGGYKGLEYGGFKAVLTDAPDKYEVLGPGSHNPKRVVRNHGPMMRGHDYEARVALGRFDGDFIKANLLGKGEHMIQNPGESVMLASKGLADKIWEERVVNGDMLGSFTARTPEELETKYGLSLEKGEIRAMQGIDTETKAMGTIYKADIQNPSVQAKMFDRGFKSVSRYGDKAEQVVIGGARFSDGTEIGHVMSIDELAKKGNLWQYMEDAARMHGVDMPTDTADPTQVSRFVDSLMAKADTGAKMTLNEGEWGQEVVQTPLLDLGTHRFTAVSDRGELLKTRARDLTPLSGERMSIAEGVSRMLSKVDEHLAGRPVDHERNLARHRGLLRQFVGSGSRTMRNNAVLAQRNARTMAQLGKITGSDRASRMLGVLRAGMDVFRR